MLPFYLDGKSIHNFLSKQIFCHELYGFPRTLRISSYLNAFLKSDFFFKNKFYFKKDLLSLKHY